MPICQSCQLAAQNAVAAVNGRECWWCEHLLHNMKLADLANTIDDHVCDYTDTYVNLSFPREKYDRLQEVLTFLE